MKTKHYNCKFCKRPGSVEYEDPGPNCPINIDRYEIACNPCAEYQRKRSDMERFMADLCQTLISGRRSLRKNPKELEKLEMGTREILKQFTIAYAKLVCAFKNMTSWVWDEDFVNELMGKPDKCFFVLSFYRKNVGKIV